MKTRTTVKLLICLAVVLLMANLNSLVDYFVHPEIAFFDEEHLIVGTTSGLLTALLCGLIFIYTTRLESLISRYKQTEKEVSRAKRQWEKTFDAIPDRIILLDPAMRIVRANLATARFLEIEPAAMSGRFCYELFRGAAAPCRSCPAVKTISDLQTHAEVVDHEDLNLIFHESAAALLDEHENLQYVVHVAKDITVQKKLEEELFQAQKMEAVGTLAGGIAHDFNNMLAVIIGYADLARVRLPENTAARKDIEAVIKAGHRAKDLVKQILTFSRKGRSGKNILLPAPIIKEVLKLLRASIPTTIEINQQIDEACGALLADPVQIHQIVVNLCTNAYQALEETGGRLDVELRQVELTAVDFGAEPGLRPGPFVKLTVRDNGPGMAPAILDRIFEPYFTTKKTGKGTGLGLSVVHGIVKGNQGLITVESQPDQGAAFHVFLPLVQSSVAPVAMADPDFLPGGHERILLVDDEPAVADMAKMILLELGYQVTGLTGSREALALFTEQPDRFDLVITDQTMPHLSGTALTEKLLKIRPDIPIILCTGYSALVSEADAERLGIKKFMMKPFTGHELATTVRQALAKNGQPTA